MLLRILKESGAVSIKHFSLILKIQYFFKCLVHSENMLILLTLLMTSFNTTLVLKKRLFSE